MGGWGERLGVPPVSSPLTLGKGLDMPVVHSETWAAQRALTHCARFPPQGWL